MAAKLDSSRAANGILCYNAPNTRPLLLSEEDNYA